MTEQIIQKAAELLTDLAASQAGQVQPTVDEPLAGWAMLHGMSSTTEENIVLQGRTLDRQKHRSNKLKPRGSNIGLRCWKGA